MARSRRTTSTVLKRNGSLITPPSEEVLGSGDIQSLADLNNSYEIVSDMRAVPFALEDIVRLAAATAAPPGAAAAHDLPSGRTHRAARQDRVLNVSKTSSTPKRIGGFLP